MKSYKVITTELSQAAPQIVWHVVNGWPVHCLWAVPAGSQYFVCPLCGAKTSNEELAKLGIDK